jgi:hypothetical protein
MKQNIQIGVVTHKEFPYSLPVGYDRILVGCSQRGNKWEGYIHDDNGENISEKNASYCELTGLYWLWKNSDADIKGLCHYRRLFSDHVNASPNVDYFVAGNMIRKECIQESTVRAILSKKDMIVTRPQKPYDRTAREDLLLYCYGKDVDILTSIICEFYPDYTKAYDSVMNSRNISYCNMLIAPKKVFDAYCEWLFSVLAHCEERCDIENYDVQHKRLFGYLAEVLLNVYIDMHGLMCAHARNVFAAEFYPTATPEQVRLAYYTEHVTHILYRIGFGKLLELLYKKYRPDTYIRYLQYLKSCDNK